jgi:hypothetical protein
MQTGELSENMEKGVAAFRGCAPVLKWLSAPCVTPALIFVFAFFLRYLYNAVFMEHRIAHFGDAYNFLRTGSCLLQAVVSSHNPAEFISKIYHAAAPQAQLLQSMSSMKLTDRLLIDGPVFPAYLAFIEWLNGIDPGNPIFDPYTVQLSLCNAVVDSLACLFVYLAGRLAFNRRAAIIAGLLFAVYPAAIINTQHCYSEPFSYFLLSVWTALCLYLLLRHRRGWLAPLLAWCGIGLFAGLMLLSKPAFILLPIMVAAAVLPVSIYRQLNLTASAEPFPVLVRQLVFRYIAKFALVCIGAALVLVPWMCFNKAVSGQYSVFVNRVPSFNIFHGNQIGTDGWRCYPFYGCFPGESKLVIASLMSDAGKQPVLFIGMQFKKVARLWAGVWNEYHYSLFGVPLQLQSLFHQLLLLAAVLSLSWLLCRSCRRSLSRSFSAALLLGVIVLFHFAYIPFEAISRYAITAMPAVILLCAALFAETLSKRSAVRALLLLLSLAIPCFLLVSASGDTANLLAALLPPACLLLAPYLSACLSTAAFAVCLWLCLPVLKELCGRSSVSGCLAVCGSIALLSALVAGAYTIQSRDWQEWHCALNPGQSVRQTILIDRNAARQRAETGTAFVLIDLSSATLAPPLRVTLNGKLLPEPPVPLPQLQPNNADILQCLALQGEGMGLDLRTFRGWWVVPFPASYLQAGDNTVELASSDEGAGVVVYGDFLNGKSSEGPDGICYLPSLRSLSYTKCFTTFDHRDPRVFEPVNLQGRTVASQRLILQTAQPATVKPDSQDLSNLPGRQYGRYRIRIMRALRQKPPILVLGVAEAPYSTLPPAAESRGGSGLQPAFLFDRPLELLRSNHIQLVQGKDPSSFLPEQKVIELPSGLPVGTRLNFVLRSRRVAGSRPYFANLIFSGTDSNGKQRSWSSNWQPIAIPPSKTWREISFCDTMPAQVLSWQNLKISPLFSPFQPDYLYLKRKDALKSSIEICRASLSFLRPLDLPPLESRDWLVY